MLRAGLPGVVEAHLRRRLIEYLNCEVVWQRKARTAAGFPSFDIEAVLGRGTSLLAVCRLLLSFLARFDFGLHISDDLLSRQGAGLTLL